MKFSRYIGVILICFVFIFTTACSQAGSGNGAENYPSETITYSIPFNPGGQSDVAARRQQPKLEEKLGQSVVIQYKPGGGGALGWPELVKKDPTGYFISGINLPHIILQPLMRENAGYKTDQIVPVAIVQATPIGIGVQKDSGIETLEELVEKAKANPGSITVAGSGTYSGHHMAFLQFTQLADIEMKYVPFTGAAPQVKNFLGGHTDVIMGNSNDLLKYKDEMNILAIGSEKTFKPLSEVPTFKELGYDMTAGIDRGVAVPPGTDEKIIKVLEGAFLEIVGQEEYQNQMYEEGFEPKLLGAEESQAYIEKKTKQYTAILEELDMLEK